MIKASYSQLLERISKASNLSIQDIERRIDAKKAKLSDLISREGAAQIVAAELGVNFDKVKVKINELLVGMRKVETVAKIIKIFPVREFQTKAASSKVCSMIVADDTANIRCVLWDTNHIKMIEEGKIKEGDVVEIKDATVRESTTKEIHLGSLSELKLSSEVINNPVTQEQHITKALNELSENDMVNVRATVVQAFEPRFFNVCPTCGKKITFDGSQFSCAEHGIVIPKERSLFNFVLDDGKANIRAVCFTDTIKQFFNITDEEIKTNFIQKRQEILGKEVNAFGRARMNKAFNNLEFIVQEMSEADPDKVIQELTIQ